MSFDFAGFKHAFIQQDVAAWAGYFAADACWLEYKHGHPPHAPRQLQGRDEITRFLRQVKSSNVKLEIEDEIVAEDRAAFRVWCTLPDGGRIIEHVMIYFTNKFITRQVDVEAWD